jgi:alkyldihydroxyacetonephosphate synthase
MKWWGWGDENVEFDMAPRPDLWRYIQSQLNMADDVPVTPPVAFENIKLPEPKTNGGFLGDIGALAVAASAKERLIHAMGKSFRDLWRVRHGLVPYAPDCVVYPESEADVCALVQAAGRHGVHLIPFGGGSNIAGCLEPARPLSRMTVSVDMRRMNRLLALDTESETARFETGVMGPHLEAQLNRAGYTLGHFPDSFLFSTLGGWVATRSAGMQSDRYGKIEDMVLAIRMVTPAGTIETREVPKASNGIDVRAFCIGSEGTLGIITEVLLAVHRAPERKATYGYLFPNFTSGLAAMRECRRAGCVPVLTRLNDPNKTALSFAYRTRQPVWKRQVGKLVKAYIAGVRRIRLEEACLMLAGFEGTPRTFARGRDAAEAVYRKYGAVRLGAEPGRAFQKGKYDFPYLRDFLLDRGVVADVSETATVWRKIAGVYHAARASIANAIAAEGMPGWVGCHISHSYHSGASLYFTFAFTGSSRQEEVLSQYLRVKRAAEDAFLASGATLSHHHAVGYEHLPWLERDVSAAGMAGIRGLKQGLDKDDLMNPGKLAAGFGFADWGLGPGEARKK